MPEIQGAEALAQAIKYYAQTLELAEKPGLKELVSSARHGLGFGEFQNGNLEADLSHYQKAIDLVASQFASMEDAQILGEYMTDYI